MTGHTVILVAPRQRDFAHRLIDAAPNNAVVTIKEGTRSLDQNAKMWAMLTDVSRAKPEGRSMRPDLWKCAFMAACGHEVEIINGIDGNPPFPADYRSSRLSKREMADLITFIQEYGDRHGVRWSDRYEV
jgi:hypothetical protein